MATSEIYVYPRDTHKICDTCGVNANYFMIEEHIDNEKALCAHCLNTAIKCLNDWEPRVVYLDGRFRVPMNFIFN
jgi:hypothetical protein